MVMALLANFKCKRYGIRRLVSACPNGSLCHARTEGLDAVRLNRTVIQGLLVGTLLYQFIERGKAIIIDDSTG